MLARRVACTVLMSHSLDACRFIECVDMCLEDVLSVLLHWPFRCLVYGGTEPESKWRATSSLLLLAFGALRIKRAAKAKSSWDCHPSLAARLYPKITREAAAAAAAADTLPGRLPAVILTMVGWLLLLACWVHVLPNRGCLERRLALPGC